MLDVMGGADPVEPTAAINVLARSREAVLYEHARQLGSQLLSDPRSRTLNFELVPSKVDRRMDQHAVL